MASQYRGITDFSLAIDFKSDENCSLPFPFWAGTSPIAAQITSKTVIASRELRRLIRQLTDKGKRVFLSGLCAQPEVRGYKENRGKYSVNIHDDACQRG